MCQHGSSAGEGECICSSSRKLDAVTVSILSSTHLLVPRRKDPAQKRLQRETGSGEWQRRRTSVWTRRWRSISDWSVRKIRVKSALRVFFAVLHVISTCSMLASLIRVNKSGKILISQEMIDFSVTIPQTIHHVSNGYDHYYYYQTYF